MTARKKIRLFQCAQTAILTVFLSTLIFVGYLAFSRQSGKMAITMIDTQKIRIDAK